MKRSTQVAAPLLAAAALSLLTGCQPEMQRCVDENNRVVDDSLCDKQPNQHPIAGTNYPVFFPYHYYYGGWGGYGIGGVVGGGSTTPSFGRSYATRSGRTIRGGFGSSFSEGGSIGTEGSHSSGAGE
jgi:hypothetical protein